MEDDFPVGRAFDRTAIYRFLTRAEIMIGMIKEKPQFESFYRTLDECIDSLLCSCPMFPLEYSNEVVSDPRFFTPYLNILEAFAQDDATNMEIMAEVKKKTDTLLRLMDRRIIETENQVDCHGYKTENKYAGFINNLKSLQAIAERYYKGNLSLPKIFGRDVNLN